MKAQLILIEGEFPVEEIEVDHIYPTILVPYWKQDGELDNIVYSLVSLDGNMGKYVRE